VRFLLALWLMAGLLGLLDRSVEQSDAWAIRYARVTTPQKLFLSDDASRLLWRDGNQLGKSWALALELLHRCRGTHPYKRTHRPPIRALVISVSFEQMAPLMEKIWALAPKDELSDKCGYDPGRGITGKPPRLVFTTGPGAGSVITFATYAQGATRIAGGTYHVIVMDEPPTESVWGEAEPRLMRLRGDLIVGMTPTPDMPPLGWLRAKVEAGQVSEHNYHLREENLYLEGALAPFRYQGEIDAYAEGLLEVERAMRIEGAWEPVVTGRWLTQFGPHNVRDDVPPPAGALVCVGIDHGAAAGKQAAVLFLVEGADTDQARAWWWDERCSDGYTTPAQDAEAILDMLRSNGIEYDQVDEWVGDRPTGDARYLVGKSNKDIRIQLARLLRRPIEGTKRISTPEKWAGSVTHGLRLINGLLGSPTSACSICHRARCEHGPRYAREVPRGIIHPRMVRFRRFAETFRGDRRDPTKDVGDAGRYPAERVIRSQPLWTPKRIAF
jgi:phage terminase large subunit-like protein